MPRPTRGRPRKAMAGLDLPPYVSQTTAAILLDPDRLAAMKETRTQEELSKELGVGRESLRRFLRAYGIQGQKGHQIRIIHPAAYRTLAPLTREVVQLAAWRAYRRLERCQPDCPYGRRCSWDDCRLDQEIRGEEEDDGLDD